MGAPARVSNTQHVVILVRKKGPVSARYSVTCGNPDAKLRGAHRLGGLRAAGRGGDGDEDALEAAVGAIVRPHASLALVDEPALSRAHAAFPVPQKLAC